MEGQHDKVPRVLWQDLPQDHLAPAPKLHQMQVNRATSDPGPINGARVLLLKLCCILVYMNQGTTQKPSHQSKSVDALLECLLDLFFLAGMHENSCGK